MSKSNGKNFRNSKHLARHAYGLRKMDKYIKWAIETRGYLKWHELVEQQTLYNIV